MPLTAIKLAELLELTSEMSGAARAGDWAGVAALEEQRQAVVAARDRGPIADGELVRIRLQEMIAANAEILRAAVLAREQVRRELDEVAKGSKAVSAYARNVG